MSFNRWAYASGNPINLTDPSGNHPGDHSKYCVPLTGGDRLSCESIVRGISPTAHVPLAEMRIYDAASIAGDDCYFWEHLPTARILGKIDSLTSVPLHESLPHSLYRGTWTEFGWWWHYLLDRTPGWWNNQGREHIRFSDVVAFALGVELNTAPIYFPDIIGYAAGAFRNKSKNVGYYNFIGSRQSVFMRVNTAVYGVSNPAPGTEYNFNKYGEKFDAKYTGITATDISLGIKANYSSQGKNWGWKILTGTGFTNSDYLLAWEWGNPTENSPDALMRALRSGRHSSDNNSILYSYPSRLTDDVGTFIDNTSGLLTYELAFVLTSGQINALCGGASCVDPLQ
jgi:hypothetical protein